MEELESIIQQMVDDGQSEENIQTIIGEWDKRNPGKLEKTESEPDDGSEVLLNRIAETESSKVQPEKEVVEKKKEKKSKYDNFFTETIPSEADVTNVPMIESNFDKLTIDRESVDNFISDSNLKELNNRHSDNGVTFKRTRLAGGQIVVKLPWMDSSRAFPIPDEDEGLERLKWNMATYINSEQRDIAIQPVAWQQQQTAIDNVWDKHSQKWNAEDLMKDELGEILGSDYIVDTAGTLGNEFTVERVSDGNKMNFRVGADSYKELGWANTSDELKRFMLFKTPQFEDTPAFKKERKEVTKGIIKNYLENPTNLNDIFKRTGITNFSNIATPKNKEILIDTVMSDIAKHGGWLDNARVNFDNLTSVDIDEIVHGVINSDIAADWAQLAERDANKEINEQAKSLMTTEGYSQSEAADSIHGSFVKQHSANFNHIEGAISEMNLLIDKENEKGDLKDPDVIKKLNQDLQPIVDKYKTRANYKTLFDSNTGKLASGIADPKSPGIIDLTDGVAESMGNFEGFSREDLKEEFVKTSAALKEWEDKTRNSKFRPKKTIQYTTVDGKDVYRYSKSDEWDVLIEQKAELIKKLEGLKRIYLLNERIDTIDKSDWPGWWEQAGRALYTSTGLADENTAVINGGATEAQTVAATKELYEQMDIPLSRAAKEHSKTSTADMIAMGVGGTPRVVIEFAGFGKFVNGAKYLMGINKWAQALGKSRFLKGSTYLSEKAITKQANRWANRRGISITPKMTQQQIIGTYAAESGIKVVAPTLFNRGIITGVGALSEGLVFTGVERDIEGMPKGIGFSLAGKMIPPALKTKLTWLNTLYKLSSGGVRMATGNQVGTAFNGLVKDLTGHEDWQVFLKNNYDDPDAVMGGIITDLVLGAGLATTHMNRFDIQSHSRIKKGMGKFDTKRRQYIDEKGNIKKGDQANFDKWNDLYNAAKRRVYENEGIQDYLDPLKAAAMAKKEAKAAEADYKELGYNGVDITFKKPDKKSRKGEFKVNKKTNKVELEIDPEDITPGLLSHELHHPLYMKLMENKPAKAVNIKKLLDITRKIKLKEDLTLYQAIKQKGVEVSAIEGMDLAKVRESELFSYISETLRNGGYYNGIKNSNGWWQLKKWIQGDTKAIVNNRSMNDIVNWFAKYNENIGGGKTNLPHFEKLAELVENMEAGVEPTIAEPGVKAPLIEGLGPGASIKLQTYKNQVGLGSERLIDNQGRPITIQVSDKEENDFNTELQKSAVKPLDAKTIKDIKDKKAIDVSKLKPEMREKLETDILNLEAGADIYKVVEMYDPSLGKKTAGTGRVINKMASRSQTPGWDVIKEDVLREFLTGPRGIKGLTADYNRKVREGDIDPKTFPLGKFIGGKFDVRFQGIVEDLQSKKFTKQVEGEAVREPVAPKDPLMEELETKDFSPRAQLERMKWLEERGLTEETAETYVAKQDLMTLSKELGLKGNIVEKSQVTIPELKRNLALKLEPQRSGESKKEFSKRKKEYNKKIVSHKNSVHQYRKSIEKDLLTNFWGISKTTADKMSTVEEVDGQIVSKKGQALKTAQAWQLKGTENKPGDLQTVKNKVEETETKTIDGKEVEVYKNVPAILTAISKGAQDKIDPVDMTSVAPDVVRGKSAGVPKVLLNLGNELLFTPTSKRAQTAAGLPPFMQSEAFIKYQTTTDQAYKTEFEQKFVESLKTPQHYKAVMQEVGKNVYLQSVRSALPKESALARQLEAGKNEGLASERLLAEQIIEDVIKGKVKPGLNGYDTLFKTPEYKKFREQGLTDAWLNKVAKIEDAGKAAIADPAKVGEIMAEGMPKPDVKMEAIEAKGFQDMLGKLTTSWGKKAKQLFHNIKTGEGVDSYTQNETSRAVQNKFGAAIGNFYPTGKKSIIVSDLSNGKNRDWIHIEGHKDGGRYELISYPKGKKQTIDSWYDHNLGGEVFTGNGKNIKDAEFWFLRESIIKDTGKVKTDLANEVVAAHNRGESTQKIIEIVHSRGREMMTNGKPENFNRVLEANRLRRQFHLNAIKHVIENHADYDLTLQEAVQAALRHVRRHTNITNGSLKGTATITAGSIEVGIPVGEKIESPTHLGTMYHSEHQLQLQNFAYTFFDSLGRNWNGKKFNTKKFNKEMDVLNELFEQSTPLKQDQIIYDSRLFGGRTTYLKTFGNKNLGEVSSILNILYRPGVAETMVDFKSEVPQTIAETILENYTKKQLDVLLKLSSKLGEPNALHHTLSSKNTTGSRKLKVEKAKPIENIVGKGSTKGLGSDKLDRLAKAIDKAVAEGRKRNKKARGMSTFDFDETVGISENYIIATKGKETRKIASHEWPVIGEKLKNEGWKMDFTDFNKVTKGKPGPLMEKLKNQIKKFGNENVFILTARAKESAPAIYEWLKSEGVDIPLKNITGLGNSTGEAKAMWMLEKFAEGYNDMYFVDDAIQNVKEVKHVLDQLDVRSKVVQVQDVNKLDSPDTYGGVLASTKLRSEYEKTIAKHRPDLVKEGLVSRTVDDMFDFIDTLNVPANKKKKYEQITTKWLATSNIKLKEDAYKLKQAVEIAEKYKEDIFSYRNPNELIEKYAGKIKKKPLDPNKTKEFTFSGEHKERGITVYEVQNTKEGQQAVRDIIDTHWGKDSNPWCITQTSKLDTGFGEFKTRQKAESFAQKKRKEGAVVTIKKRKEPGKEGFYYEVNYENRSKEGKLTDDAWHNWTAYEKGPKRIIFQDGKLSSFYANRQYWDRMDNATDGPTISVKEGRVTKKVELVDMGGGKIEESTRETRTVSKDKKTVTTEIFAESQDGYIEGTKIVENRVNGKTVKSTRYNPKGGIVEIKEFNKNGKATASYNFFPDGKMSAVNNWGQPFGDMSINDVVMKKGDVLNHQHTEGDIAYMYGRVKLNNQVTEIGWKVAEKNSDLKNVIKTVDGKVRLDLKKVLKLDPDAKGLPKDFAKPQVRKGMQNLKPVKKVLDQLDIKSDVQQALASERLDIDINTIMEHSLGVESGKRFSKAEGKVRGKDIKRRRIIMPDSAADMELLIEPLLGKGKKGIANKKWFEKNFYKPWERGVNDLNTARQTILNDYMSLRKQNKDVTKQLDKAVEGTNFTVDQAMRVYIWNKNGFKIPDLVPTTEAKLIEHIKNNPKLQSYADRVATLTKIETGLKKPSAEWWAETLASEVSETGRTVDRQKYIADWIEAKNEIFSETNLNKMESRLGSRWRSDIEDMLNRMETGRTRGRDMGRIGNKVMNYLNGSVGAIMNLNTRSATLQLISSVNFINHAENNPLAAARAFANQPQYWKDFMKIMNSDMLVQRRQGLKINVTEAELAAAVDGKGNKAKKALAWILKQGYIPTKVADSFAIASGGATYLRNRIRMYEKQGLETKEAESKAWLDFQAIAEKTQQSSRADLLSRQQTSFEGRLILPFANTPLQMNRIMMKEMLDLSKGRYKGSFGENSFTNKMSKIAYYGAIQSLIFAGLQSGLFALMANGGDDKIIAQKKIRTVNTMTDSFLRGMGVQGAIAAGVKNAVLKFLEQNEKGYNADYNEVGEALLNISPTIGSKFSKLDQTGNTFKYNKKEILKKGLSLDNTKGIEASAQTIEAIMNIPIHRVVRKTQNIQDALDKKNEDWQRLMMLLGWSKWDVGIIDKKKKKKKKKKIKIKYL